jgi:WD40 repeat protein
MDYSSIISKSSLSLLQTIVVIERINYHTINSGSERNPSSLSLIVLSVVAMILGALSLFHQGFSVWREQGDDVKESQPNDLPFIPAHVVMEQIASFLDRDSWVNLSLACKEWNDTATSTSLLPPWPEESQWELEDARGCWQSPVTQVAYSPRGTSITCATVDGRIRLWDRRTGKCTRWQTTQHHGPLQAATLTVAYTRNGNQLVTAGQDGTLKIWTINPDMPTLERTIQAHNGNVLAIAISGSSNDHIVASVGEDHAMCLWNINDGVCHKRFESNVSRSTGKLAFSPNGDLLAFMGRKLRLNIWNHHSGSVKELRATKFAKDFQFSPDGNLLAVASREHIQLWDSASWECQMILKGGESDILAMAFSGDGKLLASATEDGEIGIWNASSGQCIKMIDGIFSPISSVSFSSDSKMLLFGNHGGAVCLSRV